MASHPLVSVVIAAKNEEKNIGNCLKSILHQTYPLNKIENIVVDNNSSDKTKEIAKRYTKNVYNFGPERSAQRNFGINKAKGKYILYLDADMSLSPKLIEECVQKFDNHQLTINNQPTLTGLYIPEIVTGDTFWCKVRNFERSFYNATVIDAVRFLPKKSWEEVGGFDENLTGPEDWDFDKKVRIKGKVDIISASLYHNENNFDLKTYLTGKEYYLPSIKKYIEKWGKSDPNIKQQLDFYYRFMGVFIENGKWKKLVCFPLLAIGMYFLRIYVGLNYIKRRINI